MVWSLTRTTDLLGRPVLRSSVEREPQPPPVRRKYPAFWWDGRSHSAVRGPDYDIEPIELVRYLHSVARKRGGKVRTTTIGETVTFRYIRKESP